MLMVRALRNRQIALLWSGQALSAIGDEIYRVALIWIAVSLIGADTGYLAACQAAALLTLSLFGGKWADQWDHLRTLVRVDVARGAIVLIPVIAFYFMPLKLPLLIVVAISVSALGAFFDPALQAVLSEFSPNAVALQAATGLMSTTSRLARVFGPGVVGLLTALIPTVHFFTLDALSFAASAASIAALRRERPIETREPLEPRRIGYLEALASGFHAIARKPGMRYFVFAKAIVGGAWNLAYSLGLALFCHRLAPGNARVYGLAVAAYGAGNLTGALVIGNLRRERPIRLMFRGYLWLGAGFVLAAATSGFPALLVTMAATGFAGPMNDLPFVDIVQASYPISELSKVFRLRVALETGATLVFMLLAPTLFRLTSVSWVFALCGATIILAGVLGLARAEARQERPIDLSRAHSA